MRGRPTSTSAMTRALLRLRLLRWWVTRDSEQRAKLLLRFAETEADGGRDFGGAMLLKRGATGHCSLYRALGLNSRAGTAQGQHGDGSSDDAIERASEESFPASDPPSWTPHTTGHPAHVG